MLPNQNQIASIIRTILGWVFGLTAVSAFFHTIGVTLDSNTIEVLIGVAAGIGGFIWSLVTHTKAATVAKAADIVQIPVTAQQAAGVANPIPVPTNPKV